MDGPDGGDAAGGLDGMDHCDGPGDGLDGLDLDFDNGGLGELGYEAMEVDYSADDGEIFSPEPRRRDLTRETVNDSLLLSYDHCDVYNGSSSCLGGGYALVDAVKGTFEDDVYDPNGSRRPLNKKRLSPREIELVKKLADDPKRRLFGIHVVNHGLVSLDQEFKRIALEADCVRIDQVTPNFFASDETIPDLADWNTWKPPFTRKRVPAGYYPNAHGWTRVWKQYWQVKHKEPSKWFIDNGPKHNPNWRFDRFCNTILEITCVTWYYREACDYETRFHIRVMSMPYLDPYDKQWGYLKEPFQKYQKAARKLSELMLHRLKAAPPHPIAVKNRGEILKRLRDAADVRRSTERATGRRIVVKTGATDSQPVKTADNGCLTTSGADLVSALGVKPEMVRVKLTLPRRS